MRDSGLYPWILGSIARSLYFYGQAMASGSNRGVAAIAAYYSLFHLGLFLKFGCPKHLSESERDRIKKGLKNGAADPNPEISHSALDKFLERAVHTHALPALVLDAVRQAKNIRETINYGPRVLLHKDDRITLENCAIRPTSVDTVVADIPRVYEAAVAWACRNGEDEGLWIATSLDQADEFFAGPQRLYNEWCSDRTAELVGHMRRKLATTANEIVFPSSSAS